VNYEIPSEFYFRVHHPRPRFKNDAESVLFFVSQRIARLPAQSAEVFKNELNRVLLTYPGNAGKRLKTINNWRTEISALFGLIDHVGDQSMPSKNAIRLADKEDLVDFFRRFILTFQYPGAHLKPERAAEQISAGIKFHPGSFILQTLFEGQSKSSDGRYGISPGEATHCIFNDLRVTALKTNSPTDVVNLIASNRKSRIEYDTSGDVIRYARDVLDYMVLAALLTYRPANDTYSIRPQSVGISHQIAQNPMLFHGYDSLYPAAGVEPSQVGDRRHEWIVFVNSTSDGFDAISDITDLLGLDSTVELQADEQALIAGIRAALIGDANEIGVIGEALIVAHEQERMRCVGRQELVPKIKKIPNHFGIGYDILSFDGQKFDHGVDEKREIEVKTTRAINPRVAASFTMTTNEWSVARSSRSTYFVYRVLLSDAGISLFVIRDPYGQEQNGALTMEPRNGAEISYSKDAGLWEELLVLRSQRVTG